MQAWRRYILRALLGSLALAAIAGVTGVLVSSEVIWRVTGTCIATAVAALLLMPLSIIVDRARWQAAGLAGMVAVVLIYLLSLGLVWEADRYLPGTWDGEQLWLSILILVLAGLAAVGFLRGLHAPVARAASVVGLVLDGAFVLVAGAATWMPRSLPGSAHYYRVRGDLWSTAWVTSVLGLVAAGALVGLGRDRRHWRWVGVGASVAAVVVALAEIWGGGPTPDELIATPVSLACFIAFANLVLRVPVSGGQAWLRHGTLAAGAATALFVTLLAFDVAPDLVGRMTAAAAIASGCGSLALAVLARLNRRVEIETLPSDVSEVELFCPACRRKQTLPLGRGACRSCGLVIEVRAVVPRCRQCGYLLYRLPSGTCPECGTPVAGP